MRFTRNMLAVVTGDIVEIELTMLSSATLLSYGPTSVCNGNQLPKILQVEIL